MVSTSLTLITNINLVFHCLQFDITTSVQCYNENECTPYESIRETGTDDVECWGYRSCAFMSYIETTSTGEIQCKGSYSCYNTSRIERTDDGTNDGILCNGLFGCANVNDITNNNGTIGCRGELSCSRSIITSMLDETLCQAYRSCQHATIYTTDGVDFRGYLSGYNATVHSLADNVSIIFTGRDSGYGATVLCGLSHTCTITCHSNGCNNVKEIGCYDDDIGCTIILNCDYSERNDLCPNGYELASSIMELPSLFNLTMTTYDNSETLCTSGKGYTSKKCIDYQECANTTLSNNKPICCGAYQACRYTTNITTTVGNIRCDGAKACEFGSDSASIITEDRDADLYFSGFQACGGVDGVYGTVLGTTGNNNNVFATGHSGVRESKIKNVNDIYAMARRAVDRSIIDNVEGDIFGYGYESVRLTTISNVGGSVYCGTSASCQNSKITNVAGSVLASGLDALKNTQVTNTTNVCH